MGEPVPVILAGFGWWARNRTVVSLLEQEPSLLRVVAVTSLSGGREEYQGVIAPLFHSRGCDVPAYFEDLPQALAKSNGGPRAVIVNTPNRLHYPQARIALEAGMHVYVERPIVCPDDDLEVLIQIAGERGRLLFTGVQRRLEATYQYLHDAVARNMGFGRLASIRCTLAVGERLREWRRRRALAGGGIVVDSGYHLLDAAAWIASAAGIEICQCLPGFVFLSREDPSPGSADPLDVETTAVGHVILPGGVLLVLDLSYSAPLRSIYERVEIRDDLGGRIVLTRDQAERSTMPARMTHQRPDGTLLASSASSDFAVRMEGVLLAGAANNTGPLTHFLQSIRECTGQPGKIDVCDARSSVGTWRLVRRIYQLAAGREEFCLSEPV